MSYQPENEDEQEQEPLEVVQKRSELVRLYGMDINYLGWFSIEVMHYKHIKGEDLKFWINSARADRKKHLLNERRAERGLISFWKF